MKYPRVLTVITFLSVSFAMVLGAATPAYGCSCMDVGLNEFADEVDLAFVGQQTSRVVHDQLADNGVALTFEVEMVYRGEVPAVVVLFTHAQGSTCGVDFADAGQVSIVATNWRGQPSVNLCRSFVTEAELEQEFGVGHVPEPVASDVATAESAAIEDFIRGDEAASGGIPTWIYLGGAGLVLVLVVGGGLVGWRRLRPDA